MNPLPNDNAQGKENSEGKDAGSLAPVTEAGEIYIGLTQNEISNFEAYLEAHPYQQGWDYSRNRVARPSTDTNVSYQRYLVLQRQDWANTYVPAVSPNPSLPPDHGDRGSQVNYDNSSPNFENWLADNGYIPSGARSYYKNIAIGGQIKTLDEFHLKGLTKRVFPQGSKYDDLVRIELGSLGHALYTLYQLGLGFSIPPFWSFGRFINNQLNGTKSAAQIRRALLAHDPEMLTRDMVKTNYSMRKLKRTIDRDLSQTDKQIKLIKGTSSGSDREAGLLNAQEIKSRDTFSLGSTQDRAPKFMELVGVEPNPGPGRKQKKEKKKGTRRSQRTGQSTGLGGNPGPIRMIQQPLTASGVTGNGVSFSAVTRDGIAGLRLKGRCYFDSGISTVTTGAVYMTNASSTFADLNIYRLLNGAGNGPFYKLANCFVKWRPVKMSFSWVSAVSASTNGRLAIGHTLDITNTEQTATTIMLQQNSCSYPAWDPKCTVHAQTAKSDDLLFVTLDGASPTTLAGYALLRQCSAGAFLLSGTTSVVTAGTLIGDIWLDFVLDLFDLGPDTVTAPVSLSKDEIKGDRKVDDAPNSSSSSTSSSVSVSLKLSDDPSFEEYLRYKRNLLPVGNG